jgi:hypothetical protein
VRWSTANDRKRQRRPEMKALKRRLNQIISDVVFNVMDDCISRGIDRMVKAVDEQRQLAEVIDQSLLGINR